MPKGALNSTPQKGYHLPIQKPSGEILHDSHVDHIAGSIFLAVFTVRIPCVGNVSGVATFGIGLRIQTKKGVPLAGTPLRLRLRKRCELAGK